MKILLKLIKGVVHLLDWRRDKGRLRKRTTRRTDPVLRAPKLAGGLAFSPYSGHQALMDFAYQSKRHGQRGKPGKPILQRLDVVGNLANIRDFLFTQPCRLKEQQVRERCLRSLDPA